MQAGARSCYLCLSGNSHRGYAMPEFVLHLPEIDDTGKDYAFALSPTWLDSHLQDATLRHDPEHGQGELEVHAQENGSGEYLVTGSVHAHLITECSRCLGDAKVPVDTTFATLFVRVAGRSDASGTGSTPERRARQERYERHEGDADDEADMPREEFSGNVIHLDELVREHIVLEVPMQPLCSEQCQGIDIPAHVRPPADVFGSVSDTTDGRAVDPRLAPLQRLRDNVPPMSQPEAPTGPVAPAQSSRQPKAKSKSNKE
jgi:uncharacterized metal-binding protein YceD (DUF177 family)